MATERELMANVARGVKLLDKRDPLWWNGSEGVSKPTIDGMVGHIDLDALDMSSLRCCILGQRHSDYFAGGVNALGLRSAVLQESHGFDADSGDDRQRDLSVLAELWARVIQSRRFSRRKIAREPWIVRINRTWVRKAAA